MNTSVLISNCRHVKSKAEVPNLINTNTRCTSRPVSSAMADAHTHAHAHTCAHTRTHVAVCILTELSCGSFSVTNGPWRSQWSVPAGLPALWPTPCGTPAPKAARGLLRPAVTQSPSSPKGPLPAPHPRHAHVPFFPHVGGHFSAHTGLYVSLLNFIADLG